MSKNRKMDRRVVRTISSLQEALKSLMAQKPYAKIKVSEIVAEANVARPTFYIHYETKDALLYSLFDNVFEGFKQQLAIELDSKVFDTESFGTRFFTYWEAHSDILKILLDAEIDLIVIDQFRQCVALMTDRYRTVAQVPNDRFTPYLDDCLAGNLYMMLKRWINDGQVLTPDAMGVCFNELGMISHFYPTSLTLAKAKR